MLFMIVSQCGSLTKPSQTRKGVLVYEVYTLILDGNIWEEFG